MSEPDIPSAPGPGAASFVEQAKRMARAAERMPDGPFPNGLCDEVFGGDTVMLMLDSKGRAFQVIGATISGGTFAQIAQPRAEIAKVMDRFGVQDFDIDLWREAHGAGNGS